MIFLSHSHPSEHFGRISDMILMSLLFMVTTSFILVIVNFREWAIDSSWYESSISTCFGTLPATQLLASILGLQDMHISIRDIAEPTIRLLAYVLGVANAIALVFLAQHDSIKTLFVNTLPVKRDHKDFSDPRFQRASTNAWRLVKSPIFVLSCVATLAMAVWAGAMIPVRSTVVAQSTVDLPEFKPSIMNEEKASTGSVGTPPLSKLLAATLSSPSFSNGTLSRQKASDNTGFSYRSRSYGAGSLVGIRDKMITVNPSASAYHFKQPGYLPHVMCRYNRTMNFHIDREYPHRTFAVTGFVPDSVGSAQWSEYIGQSPNSIVAIGVADSPKSPRRFVSIAAGEHFKALNATQCTIDFIPTLFKVSVDLKDRSIVVVPLNSIEDFDTQRELTRAIVKQFDLMSNSLQSFHGSVLGDVISAHIAAWRSSVDNPPPGTIATLLGLQSFFITMTDAMLLAYASTQLSLVMKSRSTTAEVTMEMFLIGNRACVIAVAALNATLLWFCWSLRRGTRRGS